MKIEEPIYDIAHLAHVELLTPRLEESVRFFQVGNMPVTIWATTETTINSWNYFSNGVISKEYFIVEGFKEYV